MTLFEFRQTLNDPAPPSVPVPLKALWHDARGDWNEAHVAVQDDPSTDAAWVHAYLHRKEGDHGNARYWYARAQKAFVIGSLQEEWEAIASALLAGQG